VARSEAASRLDRVRRCNRGVLEGEGKVDQPKE